MMWMRRALGYVWSIATSIFYVLVVLFVFSRLGSRLEVMVVGLAGVLYTLVRGQHMIQVISHARATLELAKGLARIERLLDREAEWDDIRVADDELMHATLKAIPAALSLAAVTFICLYQFYRVL